MIGVFFAEGYEEIEAFMVVDILRRAEVEVKMISVTGELQVGGSHGIRVQMDGLIEEVDFSQLEGIVLPGGMPGTLGLENCGLLREQVKLFFAQKKLIAAICAAPMILGHLGLLEGQAACCYPGMEEELKGAVPKKDKVVKTEKIITSRGLGTALDFALAILEELRGVEEAQTMAEKVVYKK